MKNIKRILFVYLFLLLFFTVGTAQISHTVTVAPSGSFVFSPSQLTIDAGDTVVWVWDSSNHSSTSDASSGNDSWDSGILNSGASFSRVFNNVGVFPYHCTPHQSFGMTGTITVQAVSAIEDKDGITSNDFSLDQNYPNPFNPTTKITYSVPVAGKVSLKIFNLLGKEIFTLVDKFQAANKYAVTFDAGELASGIYFYRLQAGKVTITKRMVLMR